MARKTREIAQEATYHVTARANRSEFILERDNFKELFVDVLQKAKKKFQFEIINLVVMGNHIHLMIKPGKKESLSSIMQWILSVFAIHYNRLNNLKGHVWYDRFKSRIVASLLQFIRTFVYITENPLKAGSARHLFDYKYNCLSMMQEPRYKHLFSPLDPIIFERIFQLLTKRHSMS